MITLRDLFAVTWNITELDITAREPETMTYVHRWIYGEDIVENIHLYHERRAGRLSIIDAKINHHGEPTRGGSEIGWGVNEKLFPAEIIDAPMTRLLMTPRLRGNGTGCCVDIEMHPLTAQKYVKPFEEEVTT